MEKNIRQLENYILWIILFLFPIIVIPIFPNAFVTAKLTIVTVGVGILLLLKALKTYLRGSFKITTGSFDVPLLFLAISYIASTIWATPNKMEALFLPGSTSIVVLSVLLYFIINQLDYEHKRLLRLPLLASGAVVSIIALMAVSGAFKNITSWPAFTKESSFSLVEGVTSTLFFLATLVPLGLGSFLEEKSIILKTFVGTGVVLVIFGTIVALSHAIPGKDAPALPNFIDSWIIAVDSIKERPLLGIGAGNYLTAFTRFRPIQFNQSPNWQLRFTTSRNFYLTVATETGILGATAIILLFLKLIDKLKKARHEKDTEGGDIKLILLSSLLVIAIGLAIFPGTITLVIVFTSLLAIVATTHKTKLDFLSSNEEENDNHRSWIVRLPMIVTLVPLVVFVALTWFFTAKFLLAERTYMKALDSITKNDGKKSYEQLKSTITTNDQVDRYHITYAQLNLTLANALAGKQNLSEEEKKTISQLVQQAIREGKIAVALNPTRASNWDILGNIYKSIINTAQGADQFAIQTLQQAVALDPINPALRVSLGGVYYSLKMYDQAIEVFRLATATKPDWANGHYNLALAYREKAEFDRAIAELNIVLSLVDKSSKDYEVARATLEEVEKKKPSQQVKSGDQLSAPPQTAPNATPAAQIDLPADANPPAAPQETPAASPNP